MRFTGRLAVFLPLTLLVVSPASGQSAETGQTLNGGLSEEEMTVEPSLDSILLPDTKAVDAADVDTVVVTPLVRGGYLDMNGRLTIDVLERDQAPLALQVMTPRGDPVVGATVEFSVVGDSTISELEGTTGFVTDDYGIAEFSVYTGAMNIDVVTAEIGETKIDIVINVISRLALTAPELPVVENLVQWSELMQTSLRYESQELIADFPEIISSRAGDTVRIAGFMLPLQTGSEQQWFLLTSAPPHCFFDIPGGPVGTVEVLAPNGVELAWDPVVVEGRFEPIEKGEGTVYRLHDAKLVKR
ncbi:MAG: hypothetical protein AAGL69_08745 [Pseudomonadota bacterium]